MSESWQPLEGTLVRRLCEYLVGLRPKSISIEECKVWLSFRSEFTIHEPRQLSEEQAAFVDSFGLPELRSLSEHFHDTNEGIDNYACCGLQVGAEPLCGEHEGEMGPWEGGIGLYQIPNGDFLIMNRELKVGRWYHEVAWDSSCRGESAVRPFANSWQEFMQVYIEYLEAPGDAKKDTEFFQKTFY